jgi:hypothetical protein
MPDRLLLTIEQLTFYAIETGPRQFPAHEFIEALDDAGKLDLLVAARVLATTLGAGRPPAGRSERVRGSATGLYELRLTPPGRRRAHARLLHVREGNAIRCVRGVLKRERLHRRDIQLADHAIRGAGQQR